MTDIEKILTLLHTGKPASIRLGLQLIGLPRAKETIIKDYLEYDCWEDFDKPKTNCHFKGLKTTENAKKVINEAEVFIKDCEEDQRLIRRIYHILAHLLSPYQPLNVLVPEYNTIELTITKQPAQYVVLLKEFLSLKDVKPVSPSLAWFNQIAHEPRKLKNEYREIVHGKSTHSLGILDLVWKSGNPVKYVLLPYGDNEKIIAAWRVCITHPSSTK